MSYFIWHKKSFYYPVLLGPKVKTTDYAAVNWALKHHTDTVEQLFL